MGGCCCPEQYFFFLFFSLDLGSLDSLEYLVQHTVRIHVVLIVCMYVCIMYVRIILLCIVTSTWRRWSESEGRKKREMGSHRPIWLMLTNANQHPVCSRAADSLALGRQKSSITRRSALRANAHVRESHMFWRPLGGGLVAGSVVGEERRADQVHLQHGR